MIVPCSTVMSLVRCSVTMHLTFNLNLDLKRRVNLNRLQISHVAEHGNNSLYA